MLPQMLVFVDPRDGYQATVRAFVSVRGRPTLVLEWDEGDSGAIFPRTYPDVPTLLAALEETIRHYQLRGLISAIETDDAAEMAAELYGRLPGRLSA